MLGPVRVGLLPWSENMTERLLSIIPTSGWEVARLSQADFSAHQPMPHDITVVVVEGVTSSTLVWLARISRESQTPVVVVAQDNNPQTIADVLRAGADDYVVHPYASEELLARIESLILRARGLDGHHATEMVSFNHTRRSINDGNKDVNFPSREWSLLMALLEREGQVLSIAELTGSGSIPSAAGVVSTISRLRKRLEKVSCRSLVIETIHGRGYMLRVRSDVCESQKLHRLVY